MFKWLGSLVDSNDKQLKKLQPLVDKINALEPEYEKLSPDGLKEKTAEFKSRLQSGETLDDLLPEAFAAVREAAKRAIGQRHFDEQLLGGMVLHQGKIAEMKTGEGKTLVATLPLYLNSLTGRGCHLVTVNDYLSKRDPHWMGPIYHTLGVSVASIQGAQAAGSSGVSFMFDPGYESEDKRWPFMRPITRNEAYGADITYGTNNEFGFDYLRDNMVVDLKQCVQRELHYAIVDEVDNILIDEARTPLIISGPAEQAQQKYQIFARLIPNLKKDEDYAVDEKHHAVSLTDTGINHMEHWLQAQGVLNSPNLYDPSNAALSRYLDNALKAQYLYQRDREYVVKGGQVIIVDEFTGHLMHGRRYSEGLHQAIEAKERVRVREETRTYATITFQNYFRMHEKLAGMTGTAATEAEEFFKIYKLDVMVIPTNRPMIRKDFSDQIYKNEESKFKAVVKEVEGMHKDGRPILIGTVSIEKSEILGDMMKKRGVQHQVLNAKQHEKEAMIIAQAGKREAVTVATNMAGRGVDIILGGNPAGSDPQAWQREHDEVVKLGGLHVIGTERHEARRIDNQLRGRSGRQGDPGSTRFYVSLEDDIMRRFGGDRIKTVMEWAGIGEDIPIENKLVSSTIENAQVRVEGYHFDVRKHLVEYDDVINTQRGIIYGERRKILTDADLKSNILDMVREEISDVVSAHAGERVNGEDVSEEEKATMLAELGTIMPLPKDLTVNTVASHPPDELEEIMVKHTEALYEQLEKTVGTDNMRMLERLLMIRVIDNLWVEHLTTMDYIRQGVALQAVAQRDPLAIYKKEGGELFDSLKASIRHDVVHTVFHVNIQRQPQQKQPPQVKVSASPMARVAAASRGDTAGNQSAKIAGKKVGRNDPCPCGSGKKYKHCCGR
ncbi:MAG: preprotein translocase subunit SecA [Dehalococcoidia bacterium]|nr:preprotein translocase subunit SecA [Dehalococcoidia bacterium]